MSSGSAIDLFALSILAQKLSLHGHAVWNIQMPPAAHDARMSDPDRICKQNISNIYNFIQPAYG